MKKTAIMLLVVISLALFYKYYFSDNYNISITKKVEEANVSQEFVSLNQIIAPLNTKNRILVLTLELETDSKNKQFVLNKKQDIENIIKKHLETKTYADVEGIHGIISLKSDLKNLINTSLSQHCINKIFFIDIYIK